MNKRMGCLMLAVLLCVMFSGISEFLEARQELQQMQNHVISQRQQNALLREKYEDGIDLEEIQRAALALGMVPEDQVRHITISVPMEQTVPQNNFLTQLTIWIPEYFE